MLQQPRMDDYADEWHTMMKAALANDHDDWIRLLLMNAVVWRDTAVRVAPEIWEAVIQCPLDQLKRRLCSDLVIDMRCLVRRALPWIVLTRDQPRIEMATRLANWFPKTVFDEQAIWETLNLLTDQDKAMPCDLVVWCLEHTARDTIGEVDACLWHPVLLAIVNGSTPRDRCTDLIQRLGCLGVPLGSSSPHGLLHAAVAQQNLDLLAAMLTLGLDVNATNNQGDTPLHWVARYKWTQGLQLLLARSPATGITNERGSTPLHTAVHHKWVAGILALGGQELLIANKQYQTPLFLALKQPLNVFRAVVRLMDPKHVRDHGYEMALSVLKDGTLTCPRERLSALLKHSQQFSAAANYHGDTVGELLLRHKIKMEDLN